MPKEAAREQVRNHKLVTIPLDGVERQIAVIHRKGKVLSPAMKKLIEMLKEA